MNLKEKLIEYFRKIGKTDYRIRYYPCSRYQKRYKPEFREEECWVYPKETVKEWKTKFVKGKLYHIVNKDGSAKMVSKPGLLIRTSDLDNKDYMENI